MGRTTTEELEVRSILRAQGATLRRSTSNGHEMWNLPSGRSFTIPGSGKRSDFRAWKNALSDLRRFLREDAELEAQLIKEKDDGPPPQPKPVHHSDPPQALNPVIPSCFKKGYNPASEKCVNCKHELACVKTEKQSTPKYLPGYQAPTYVRELDKSTTLEATMPKKPHHTRWSDDEDMKLLELFEAGKSDKEIAAKLGRKPAAVQKRRNHLGLFKRKRRVAETQKPPAAALQTLAPKKKKTPPPDALQSAAVDIETVGRDGSPVLVIVYPNGRRIVEKITTDKANELVLKILGGGL